MTKTHHDVVVIGGGPAGISAAIWCKRLGIDHLLIEAHQNPGGQLKQIHNEIVDYPGHVVANGEALQHQFISHLNEINCSLCVSSTVKTIKNKKVCLSDDEYFSYKFLIFAAGSSSRKLEIPGEKEMIDRGEVYSASRDSSQFQGKQVAVVGGGDRAFEGALLLANKGANVYLIHRSTRFRARKDYTEPVMKHKNVHVFTNSMVKAIHGDRKVDSIVIENSTGTETLLVDAVIVRIGSKPNSELVEHLVLTNDHGFIQTDQYGRTSDPTIYAAGDVCTNPFVSSISSAVGQGMIAAKHLSTFI